MSMRAGILCIHPAPYRDATLRDLQASSSIEVDVHMLYDQDVGHLEWKLGAPPYKYYTVGKGIRLTRRDRLHLSVIKVLANKRYDVIVVPGYSRATALAALSYCWASNTPYVLALDTIESRRQIGCLGTLRRKLAATIIRRASALWVPGVAARRFAVANGYSNDRIFEGAYCFDVPATLRSFEISRARRTVWRESYAIPLDAFVFMHVGQMESFRRVGDLCVALSSIVQKEKSAHLVLIGNGPLFEETRAFVQSRNMNMIHLCGALPFAELFDAYAGCDAYVHAGCEAYSTSMELAALGGLPIVSTNRVGYAIDVEARGGRIIMCAHGDSGALARHMLTLLADPASAALRGGSIRQVAVKRTSEWAAMQITSALARANT